MLIALVRGQLHPYRRAALAVVLWQSLQALAALYLPTLNADLIDNGVLRGDTGRILRIGAVMLAVTLVQVGCAIAAVHAAARIAMGLGRDLRADVFARVQAFSAREFARFGAPSLITRTTNDVAQVQALVLMTATMAVPAPIMCLGGIALATRQDVPLSALLVASLPVLILTIMLLLRRMRPLFRRMQDQIDGVNRVLREQITGIRVIRAFVREEAEHARFAAANRDLMEVSLGVGRLMALMLPVLMAVVNLSSVAVLWVAAHRIDSGAMQIGALTAFLSYLVQILMSVMMATFALSQLPRAEVCAERILEVLRTKPDISPPAEPVVALPTPGTLEFRGAQFRYPGAEQPVLHGIDLSVVRGGVTAIVGSTGAGKTTLLDLVPRLLDVTGGEVLVGGADVRRIDRAALSRAVAFVPQRPYLFSGTVASNLRYGRPDATDEDLWAALETAQAREFVEAMPAGLGAPIAQGGSNVSGGQRQRLAIARALLVRPDLYLFDDAFSALDVATDARLRAGLARWTAGATVVVVAQRVSSIRDADRIVVLEQGAVAGTGTHRELMASNATYREIALSQLTEQEAQ